MKHMKLGSRQDGFRGEGNNIRYVASELTTDVIINVGEVKFYLHKFPLLSKCKRLQSLILKVCEDNNDEVQLHDIPGGPKAFEICAKFCYGMVVTLNAYNVVAARCAAEYLAMTEDVEQGNLVFKIEVFLNSCVMHSWKDSIIALQMTKSLLPWSEELKIVGRCIDSIASKTSVDPSNVNWSYTYNKNFVVSEIVGNGQKTHTVPSDWWVEDICELDVSLYKRVIISVKSKGRMSSDLIGEALKAYAIRWLPDSYGALVSDDYARRNKSLVEAIIWLLPSDKGSGCSCRFLLKLLKVVIMIEAGDLMKEDLMNRISMQLQKAAVKDLLIPSRSPGDTVYDVDLVKNLVSRFVMHYESEFDPEFVEKRERTGDFILGHESLLSLGKLVDGYLAEISSDSNLPISSFIDLSALVPEEARPVHDGLYAAIDIYLMKHLDLTKAEKKRICGLMDIRKLSTEACVRAAQNERLPLRVIVQVLYFEQLRVTARHQKCRTNKTSHGSTQFTKINPENHCKPLKKQPKNVKIEEDELCTDVKKSSSKKVGGFLMPSRSRRIFDMFWVGKEQQGENNRSSEATGRSHSPLDFVANGEHKSSGSSSSHRRHSVS